MMCACAVQEIDIQMYYEFEATYIYTYMLHAENLESINTLPHRPVTYLCQFPGLHVVDIYIFIHTGL